MVIATVGVRASEVSRVAAIRMAARLARILIPQHPEVLELYRREGEESLTLTEIVEKLNLMDNQGITEEVAELTVRYIIGGYEGGFGVEAYQGLTTKEEARILGKKHIARGVRISARKVYEERRGIHAMTAKEKAEACGHVHWVERRVTEDACYLSEIEVADRLRQSPDYRHKDGRHRGTPNLSLVTSTVNNLFHGGEQVRIPHGLCSMLRYYRRTGRLA